MAVDFKKKVAEKVVEKFGFDLTNISDSSVIRATVRDGMMDMDNKDMAHDRVIIVGILKPILVTVKNQTYTQDKFGEIRQIRIGKQVDDDGYLTYFEANKI